MSKLIKRSFPAPHVLLLELARPPVNAFNEALWREMHALIDQASADPAVLCVVLSSALPKLFTAGLDITDTSSLSGQEDLDVARRALLIRQHVLDFQAAISSIEHCIKPVIGATYGPSPGLAIDILSACDIRLAASNTVFSIKEVDVGLAADIGTLQRFPRIVGNGSVARELALTARPFDAEEALRIGFISRVVPGAGDEVKAAAIELAKLIASKSPIAVIGTKHLINASRDMSIAQGLAYTAAYNAAALQSDDLAAAMGASMSKTKPEFAPLPALPKPKL